MQTLPAQVLEQIFQHTDSTVVSGKSCVNLAIRCKAFRDAFADSGRQESCKKAALKRLLRWSAKIQSTLYIKGKVLLHIRATLDKRKTQRLIEWLESGCVSIENFWEAQDPRVAISKIHGDAHKLLSLVLVEKFPRERVLDRKAKKVLQYWMAHFAPLALTDFNGVQVLHDPSNGEQLEQLFRIQFGFHLVSPVVGE